MPQLWFTSIVPRNHIIHFLLKEITYFSRTSETGSNLVVLYNIAPAPPLQLESVGPDISIRLSNSSVHHILLLL